MHVFSGNYLFPSFLISSPMSLFAFVIGVAIVFHSLVFRVLLTSQPYILVVAYRYLIIKIPVTRRVTN